MIFCPHDPGGTSAGRIDDLCAKRLPLSKRRPIFAGKAPHLEEQNVDARVAVATDHVGRQAGVLAAHPGAYPGGANTGTQGGHDLVGDLLPKFVLEVHWLACLKKAAP